MDITPFIEKEILSKRFVVAMTIILAWALGAQIPSEIVALVVGFYFGSHQSTSLEATP